MQSEAIKYMYLHYLDVIRRYMDTFIFYFKWQTVEKEYL